eukprot:1072329-Pelagomonas_calceolata.AAC.2
MQVYCASLTCFAACIRAVCGSGVLWTFFWLALCTWCQNRSAQAGDQVWTVAFFWMVVVILGQLLPYPGCSADRFPVYAGQ